jgi:hypothetical protein
MSARSRIVRVAALVLAGASMGCTETPDDLPECVGSGSYCPPDDGGAEGGADSGPGVDAGTSTDAGQDAAVGNG